MNIAEKMQSSQIKPIADKAGQISDQVIRKATEAARASGINYDPHAKRNKRIFAARVSATTALIVGGLFGFIAAASRKKNSG
jgi:hypothetical protein